jgi:hypothetical protein
LFKLAESRRSNRGVYCSSEGLYLGASPLIHHTDGAYRLRPTGEIAALLGAAYEPTPDIDRLLLGLRKIAAALQRGDLPQAMISALLLRLEELSEAELARLADAEALLKVNFNPAQPRDGNGRWTTEGSPFRGPSTTNHPALVHAQEAFPARLGGPNEISTQVAQNTPLDFSTHAWTRMQQRGITPDQVIDAIKNGSRVTQPNGNIGCTGAGCVVVIDPSGRIVTIY